MGFIIADDSENNVEQSIMFGGEELLPSPEEAIIDAKNRASHTLNTALASDEE